ncbi:hypothetical protein Y032_0021g449 [Ancylostoma ceylanicum]|uniref:Uncharacterized protein n=1 Tax=Ancylostoma ceylanicum TaxID=53326 RepID=A0A016V052_9BILA|nr:hypothetical protein Y032_0021g449 [Ancylostoma ceylanicum]
MITKVTPPELENVGVAKVRVGQSESSGYTPFSLTMIRTLFLVVVFFLNLPNYQISLQKQGHFLLNLIAV